MSDNLKEQILRAWRDPDYYLSLSEEERARIPANPAALLELSADALDSVTGAGFTATIGPTSSYCSPCGTKICY